MTTTIGQQNAPRRDKVLIAVRDAKQAMTRPQLARVLQVEGETLKRASAPICDAERSGYLRRDEMGYLHLTSKGSALLDTAGKRITNRERALIAVHAWQAVAAATGAPEAAVERRDIARLLLRLGESTYAGAYRGATYAVECGYLETRPHTGHLLLTDHGRDAVASLLGGAP